MSEESDPLYLFYLRRLARWKPTLIQGSARPASPYLKTNEKRRRTREQLVETPGCRHSSQQNVWQSSHTCILVHHERVAYALSSLSRLVCGELVTWHGGSCLTE